MRIFSLMPKGVDLTPCQYCSNPIAELHDYQCMHDMGSEYAPCKQLERLAKKRRGERIEIMWVCIVVTLAIGVILMFHNP
jgi:hypothetical protein